MRSSRIRFLLLLLSQCLCAAVPVHAQPAPGTPPASSGAAPASESALAASVGALAPSSNAPAGKPLPPDTDPRFIAALYNLRDAVYMSEDPADVEKAAGELSEAAKAQPLDEANSNLVLSRIEYLAGRSWNEGGDKKKAIPRFETAVEYARASMKSGEHPGGLMALTKPLSELCLLKGMGFLVANGPQISRNARKILAMEPGHPGAMIVLASAKAYPPPIFGGNPKEAIEEMTALIGARSGGFEKDDLFDIRMCMGTASSKLGRKEDARLWFEAALALYPSNAYARGELAKVAP